MIHTKEIKKNQPEKNCRQKNYEIIFKKEKCPLQVKIWSKCHLSEIKPITYYTHHIEGNPKGNGDNH